MEKYFEAVAKSGHVGRGKNTEMPFYVMAEKAKEAAKITRSFPRVKRYHKFAISNIREISSEEYLEGLKKNKHNPYLRAKCIQDQRAYCRDIDIIAGDWRETLSNSRTPRSEKKNH